MSKIIVYEGNRRRGSTSDAFNDIVTEELMREYTLSFSIANTDSIFPLISEKSVFSRGGQLFDLTGINTNTITSNITQITAEHVSYRLNDYTILAGYAFVGTLRDIAEDILNVSENINTGGHAADAFKIGGVPDTSEIFSFRMQNTSEATARDAVISLQKLGVEIEFDNYTVNIVKRRGLNCGLEFNYTANLEETQRVYERGNGWTYDIKAALLTDEYSLGDDIIVNDALIGKSRSERIITVVDCADDPTQNRIVTGVFVLDSATQSAETERIVENSVQQGKKYNNVYINHGEGFVAENKAGTQRVIMNADDCFSVQVLKNGKWITASRVDERGLAVGAVLGGAKFGDLAFRIDSDEEGDVGWNFYDLTESDTQPKIAIHGSRIKAYRTVGTFTIECDGDFEVQMPEKDWRGNDTEVTFKRGSETYGVTKSITIDGKTLIFKSGILTETL